MRAMEKCPHRGDSFSIDSKVYGFYSYVIHPLEYTTRETRLLGLLVGLPFFHIFLSPFLRCIFAYAQIKRCGGCPPTIY